MARLIDMEAVIQHFGSQAVSNYTKWDKARDENALNAIESSGLANRHQTIRSWLEQYRVFQGFSTQRRNDVTTAILQWADARQPNGRLNEITALCDTHKSLMEACSNALGNSRDFTSLASKALWLCYPEDVPIFDSVAQRALCVISKLEGEIDIPSENATSRYARFTYPWKALFERYSPALYAIGTESCRYQVRIFDAVLLCLGENAQ